MKGKGLTPDELAFTREHARQWACPDVDPMRARAYSDFYMSTFASVASDMSDLPSHPSAWNLYLAESDKKGK